MRKIKFRAKLRDGRSGKNWLYGAPVVGTYPNPRLYFEKLRENGEYLEDDWAYVDPKTICQFIGKKDSNGKDIYDGDIIRCTIGEYKYEMLIYWNNNRLQYGGMVKGSNGKFRFGCFNLFYLIANNHCEVIGNRFDNPEMLKPCK